MTTVATRPIFAPESIGQQQLFELIPMSEHWQDNHRFLATELAEEVSDITTEDGFEIAVTLMAIAAEAFALELATTRGLDRDNPAFCSESLIARVAPKGDNTTDDPFSFDADHDSEFATQHITPEFVTALTNRAYRMAETATGELSVANKIKEFAEVMQ